MCQVPNVEALDTTQDRKAKTLVNTETKLLFHFNEFYDRYPKGGGSGRDNGYRVPAK